MFNYRNLRGGFAKGRKGSLTLLQSARKAGRKKVEFSPADIADLRRRHLSRFLCFRYPASPEAGFDFTFTAMDAKVLQEDFSIFTCKSFSL